MNWQSLGGALIKAGAPIIGTALGGPLGGMIGDAVGGVLAGTLGVPAAPDAVNDALKTAPAGELQAKLSAADAEAAAKWPALAEIARAEADANMRALDAVNRRCGRRRLRATPCNAGGGRSMRWSLCSNASRYG